MWKGLSSTLRTRTSRVKKGSHVPAPGASRTGPQPTTPANPPVRKQPSGPQSLDNKAGNSKTSCLSPRPSFIPKEVWCSIRKSARNRREEKEKSARNEMLLLGAAGLATVGVVLYLVF